MTDAEVSYSALEAVWVYLHSSHDSVAFEHGLIPNKEAVPSHSFGGMLLRVFKVFPAVFTQRQLSQWELQGR